MFAASLGQMQGISEGVLHFTRHSRRSYLAEPTHSNGLGASWAGDMPNYIYMGLNMHEAKVINFFSNRDKP